jgi:hypothetical protein
MNLQARIDKLVADPNHDTAQFWQLIRKLLTGTACRTLPEDCIDDAIHDGIVSLLTAQAHGEVLTAHTVNVTQVSDVANSPCRSSSPLEKVQQQDRRPYIDPLDHRTPHRCHARFSALSATVVVRPVSGIIDLRSIWKLEKHARYWPDLFETI